LTTRRVTLVEMVFKNACRASYNALREEWGLKAPFDHGFVKDLSSQRAAHTWLSFLVAGFILHAPCKAAAADCIAVV
jgi:hypothetical protein